MGYKRSVGPVGDGKKVSRRIWRSLTDVVLRSGGNLTRHNNALQGVCVWAWHVVKIARAYLRNC